MPRNILIDPQRLGTGRPSIQFSGSIDNQIKLEVSDLGDLNFKNDLSGNSLLFVSGSGNVGIGTTNALGRFYVSGSSSTTQSTYVIKSGISSPTAPIFEVQDVLGNTLFNVTGSGNVGIGFTRIGFYTDDRLVIGSPSGTSPFGIIIGESFASGAGRARLGLADAQRGIGLNSNSDTVVHTWSTNNLLFGHGTPTSLTERVRVDASGNVGIGTNNTDGNRLAVNGSVAVTGSILPHGDNTRDLGSPSKRWANLYVVNLNTTSITANLTGSGLQNGSVLFSGATGGITGSQSQFFWDNATQRLGIGTSSPSSTFSLTGTGFVSLTLQRRLDGPTASPLLSLDSSSGVVSFQNASNTLIVYRGGTLGSSTGTESMRIDSSGNVGIGGTSTPGSQLDVYSSTGRSVRVGYDSPAYGVAIQAAGSSWARYYSFQDTSNNLLGMFGGFGGTNSLTYLFVGAAYDNTALRAYQTTGNVAIGNANDLARLYVTGSSTASTPTMIVKEGAARPTGGVGIFNVQNSAGSSLFFVSGSGFVGFNTITPAYNLDVYNQSRIISDTSPQLTLEAVSNSVDAGLIFRARNSGGFSLRSQITQNSSTGEFIINGDVGGNASTGRAIVLQLLSSEKVRIDYNGNVGIGTSLLDSRLVVNGTSVFSGSVNPDGDGTRSLGSSTKRWSTVFANNLTGSLTKLSSGGDYLIAGANISLITGSNGSITIASSSPAGTITGTGTANYVTKFTGTNTIGNGIATDNGSTFTVNGNFTVVDSNNNTFTTANSTSAVALLNIRAPSGKSPQLTFTEDSIADRWVIGSSAGNASLIFSSGNAYLSTATERMRIDGSGNVGIGTSNPAALLTVSGTIVTRYAYGLESYIAAGTYSAGTTGFYPTSNAALSLGFGSNDTIVKYGAGNNSFVILHGSTPSFSVNGSDNVSVGAGSYSARLFVSGSSTSSTPTMVVKEGVVSPTAGVGVLDVQNSAGTTLLFVSGSGRIGIGSSTPGYDLQIGNGSTVGTRTLAIIDSGYGVRLVGGNGNGILQSLGTSVPLELQAGNGNNGNYIFSSTGNVGIGTATVTSKLHVYTTQNDATATPSVDINAAFVRLGDATTALTFNNGVGIKFHDAGNVHYSIGQLSGSFYISQTSTNGNILFPGTRTDIAIFNSSGNVGIGTSLIDSKLVVNGNSVFSGSVNPDADLTRSLGSSTKRWSNIYAANISGSLTGSNISAGQVVVAGTGGVLSGSNNFWWDNSAQTVGIGTNSPLAKLDVRGNIGIGGGVTYGNGITISSTNTSAANHTHYFRGPAAGTNDDVYFDLNRGGGAYGSFNVNFAGSTILGVGGGSLRYSGNILLQPIANVQISTGKLSIGGATPVSQLEVTGSGNTSSTSTMHLVNGSNTSLMFVRNDGNVGIGSSSPVERLDVVSGSVRAKYYFGSYDGEILAGTDAGGYYFASGAGKSTAIPIFMGNSGVTYISLRTNGTERLRIDSTGLLPGTTNALDIGSSGQRWRDVYARTGSFSGDVSISGNLTVLGVQTYVSSTVVDIGDNIITLNSTANPQRYGGLYVNDTTAGTTGSLLWDSDNNYWVSGIKGLEVALPTGAGSSGLVTRWTGTNTLGTGVLYDNGTNVGIGAASDGTKLYVRKDDTSTYTETGFNTTALHLRNGTGGLSSVSLLEFSSANSGAAWWIGQVESSTANQGILVFQARTGASTTAERLRINTSGNVGIGVTNPGYTLDVGGAIAIRGNETADNPRLYFQASDQSNRFTIESDLDGTTTNDLLGFRSTSVDNILVLKGNGSVGIGVTNPLYSLSVNGTTSITGSALPGQDNTYNLGSTSFRWANLYAVNFSGTSVSASLTGSGLQNGSVLFSNATGGITGSQSQFFWDNTNNRLGIGTSSPAQKLDVSGTIKTGGPGLGGRITFSRPDATGLEVGQIFNSGSSGLTIEQGGGGAFVSFNVGSGGLNGSNPERVRIDSSGNVGIGSISPGYKLDVVDSVAGIVSVNVRNTSNNAGAYSMFRTSNDIDVNTGLLRNSSTNTGYAGANSLNLYTQAAYPLGFVTNNVLRAIIDSSGNVGIGTTDTNGNKLAVNGDMAITGSILPHGDNARDLGSSTKKWRGVFASSGSFSTLVTTAATTSGSYSKTFAAGESGRLTATISLAQNENKSITISSSNGAVLFDIMFVASESDLSVAKKYTVATQYASNPVSFKIVDTGPYGSPTSYDVTVAFSKDSVAVTRCTFSHNYPGSKNISVTLDVAAVSTASTTSVTIFP